MTLALRDDVDSLMHLELMMADRDSADKLAKRFQKRAGGGVRQGYPGAVRGIEYG